MKSDFVGPIVDAAKKIFTDLVKNKKGRLLKDLHGEVADDVSKMIFSEGDFCEDSLVALIRHIYKPPRIIQKVRRDSTGKIDLVKTKRLRDRATLINQWTLASSIGGWTLSANGMTTFRVS